MQAQRAAQRHLITNHLAGSAPVTAYTPYQSQPWLSFHLYHSGHALNVGTSCQGSNTTWQSLTGLDELGRPQMGIMARQFRVDGAPRDDEFSVSTSVQPRQESPAAGADAAGNLVVGWVAKGQAVVVRLFDSDGTAISAEIPVNTSAPEVAELVEVVVDPLGSFAVRWNEYSSTDELLGWYSRAFDAKGQPLGDVVSEDR